MEDGAPNDGRLPFDSTPSDSNAIQDGAAGCVLGRARCSADSLGMEYCGLGTAGPAWSKRIPCDPNERCAAGVCTDRQCNASEIVFLLDRSSSMAKNKLWDWTSKTLLATLQPRPDLYLALRQFPQGGCNVAPVTKPKQNAYADFEQAIGAPDSASATPIAAALTGLAPSFGDPDRSQAVVLISDGDETCATATDAVNAAARLYHQGIRVYTIALTSTANVALLDQIATVGGTNKSRLATDDTSLRAALDAIIQADLNSCLCQKRCLIDGVCYADQHSDPKNVCRRCDVAQQPGAWTMLSQCLYTLAGNGTPGYQDGPIEQARFASPRSLAFDPSGTLYVVDSGNHCVRIIKQGLVGTFAGSCTNEGFAQGKVANARFRWPNDIVVEGSVLYLTDGGNHAVVKIGNGVVSLIAGNGGIGSQDGIGQEPRFYAPMGIAVAANGSLYVADQLNHRIRQVDAASGEVTTIAGPSGAGVGVGRGLIDGAAADARFHTPVGLAFDRVTSTLYIADRFNGRIRTLASNRVRTVASGLNFPAGVSVAGNDIYVADTDNDRVVLLTGGQTRNVVGAARGMVDGAVSKARLNEPYQAVIHPQTKAIYIVDRGNHAIRVFVP